MFTKEHRDNYIRLLIKNGNGKVTGISKGTLVFNSLLPKVQIDGIPFLLVCPPVLNFEYVDKKSWLFVTFVDQTAAYCHPIILN